MEPSESNSPDAQELQILLEHTNRQIARISKALGFDLPQPEDDVMSIQGSTERSLREFYCRIHEQRAMYESIIARAEALEDLDAMRLAREIQLEEEQSAEIIFCMIRDVAGRPETANLGAYLA